MMPYLVPDFSLLMADYDVSVIIVNYNGAKWLPGCLEALTQATGSLRVETILIDNGSTDGSVGEKAEVRRQNAEYGVQNAEYGMQEADGEALENTAPHPSSLIPHPFPSVLLLAGENLGFSRASNIGLRMARGRYCLLLNTDCFLRPGALEKLVACLDKEPKAAVVGPRLLNLDGTLQRSCHNFPTPVVLFLEQSLLWKVLRRIKWARRWLFIAGDHAAPGAVDWLSGACMLLRQAAVEPLGGLDEAFFFYWEEAELCLRLRQHGWKTLFEPKAEALHAGGGSGSSPMLLRQFFTSLYIFYHKHYSSRALLVARVIVRLMAFFKMGRAGLSWLLSPNKRPAISNELHSWLSVIKL